MEDKAADGSDIDRRCEGASQQDKGGFLEEPVDGKIRKRSGNAKKVSVAGGSSLGDFIRSS